MPEPVVADTPRGRLRGWRAETGLTFRGIRYATAERFARPVPEPPWTGVRDAVDSGPACPQPDRAVARFTHGPPPALSEAGCLNLNVFTPALEGRRPVMVWLHGGGFAIGHASASLYEGARLAAAADAVVVAVNYRLGSFGWLCHPALANAPGDPTGNWGLLDQIAALDWVQENIASFGGDPGQVTVAGQSAGALAALDLLLAPAATGRFHRLILESPPLGDVAQPPEPAQRFAGALSAALGFDAAPDRDQLGQVPAEALVAAHEAVLARPEFRGLRGALPTLEPATLPVTPVACHDVHPEVAVLIGSTAQEGTFFFRSPWRPAPPPERIPDVIAHLYPAADVPALIARAGGHALNALVDVATERMVAGPARAYAHARAAAVGAGGGPVWLYRVDHPGAGPELGATHTVEVPLVFGTWRDGEAGQRLAGQAAGADAVSSALVAVWGAFLRGEPLPWAALSQGRGERGVFGGAAPYVTEALLTEFISE